MKLSKLEQAQKTYLRLKELDAEVIEIEKIASQVLNGDCKITLSIEDFAKKAELENKVEFDEDGSLVKGNSHRDLFSFPMISFYERPSTDSVSKKPKKEATDKHKFILSDTATVLVLQVVLAEKQKEREYCLRSLEKMGVAI